jgi:hypothetical protein
MNMSIVSVGHGSVYHPACHTPRQPLLKYLCRAALQKCFGRTEERGQALPDREVIRVEVRTVAERRST